MARVQLDEAVAGSQGGAGFISFPIDVAEFELRLLGKTAIREAGFELFQILGGFIPVAFALRILGFGIELAGRPAAGLVVFVGRAAGSQHGGHAEQQQGADEGGKRRECG